MYSRTFETYYTKWVVWWYLRSFYWLSLYIQLSQVFRPAAAVIVLLKETVSEAWQCLWTPCRFPVRQSVCSGAWGDMAVAAATSDRLTTSPRTERVNCWVVRTFRQRRVDQLLVGRCLSVRLYYSCIVRAYYLATVLKPVQHTILLFLASSSGNAILLSDKSGSPSLTCNTAIPSLIFYSCMSTADSLHRVCTGLGADGVRLVPDDWNRPWTDKFSTVHARSAWNLLWMSHRWLGVGLAVDDRQVFASGQTCNTIGWIHAIRLS